ncbi:MAG TPA: asparagine synthase (glutamine-hydrolyzing) [Candidatus Polarisedimenticolia bacterium]|nr:asparagine synthase (glutamine-hydrolyzing) [Candidatus Polarisedimenticolia bacterium]
MCGICGVFYDDAGVVVDRVRLIAMRDRMAHRGPDGEGLLVDPGLGLGHRRLSIIDIACGQQPMSNEDGSLWIIFNGEIYNYEPLRRDLLARGHVFKTRSDTETILHLYEERGPDCVDQLNGMFTFAIWDRRSRQLFLARDRMGVKPLYLWRGAGVLLFASEIKALFAWDFVRPELRRDCIPEYLVFRHLAGERTFFEGIRTLEPGHTMLVSASGTRTRRWWHLPFTQDKDDEPLDRRAEELDQLLADSVKLRLMSEVPLGTYCSGGIDSSLITAYTSRLTTTELNTFSVGFEDPGFDESRFARLASQICKTKHHPLTVTEEMFSGALPESIWFHDQPLNHANSICILLLSRLAKQSVTVMLSGEGSDELFGGYPRYRAVVARGLIGRLPMGLPGGVRGLVRRLGGRRLDRLMGLLSQPFEEMIITNAAYMDDAVPRSIFPVPGDWTWTSRRARLAEARADNNDPYAWMFYLDLLQYLVCLLDRQDKMSMAAGIEARVPFLDYRVVQLALGISAAKKVSAWENKILVKRLAERYLPKEIVYRKKSGFGVPLDRWFRNRHGLGRYLDHLASASFRERGLWDMRQVEQVIDDHVAGRAHHGELLWELLNLELWSRMYLDEAGEIPAGIPRIDTRTVVA